jgi:hypothetical protein
MSRGFIGDPTVPGFLTLRKLVRKSVVIQFAREEAALVILSQSVAAAKNLVRQGRVMRFFGLRPQNDSLAVRGGERRIIKTEPLPKNPAKRVFASDAFPGRFTLAPRL